LNAMLIGIIIAVFTALYIIYRSAMRPPRLSGPLDAVGAAPPPAPNPLLAALSRSRDVFAGLFDRGRERREALEALEEALLRSDVGAATAAALVEEIKSAADLRQALRTAILARLRAVDSRLVFGPAPHVVLVVGVNGSGKTTTIGKLAGRLSGQGKRVIMGAGDTFRAGAIEQLKVWAARASVEIVAQQEGSDPAAVAHQTCEAAVGRNMDVVLCDTAGRLQAQKALMDELAKVRRVVGKVIPGAPHEVLLVLDATMGQNALSQARLFKDVAGVTGVVLTKLDGTAKGGVVVAIAAEFGLPVKLVGVGEKIEDLRDFDPVAFVDALLPSADPA
jgi:fused signal recognition particle receptor